MSLHKCVKCLKPVKDSDYFSLDFVCRPCARKWDTFPLAATTGPIPVAEIKRQERKQRSPKKKKKVK